MKRMTWQENKNRSWEVGMAYVRQGFKEVGAIFYGANTVAQSPEYGMANTKLPSEIAQDLKDEKEKAPTKDNSATLAQYSQQAPDYGVAAARDDRHPERE